MEGHQCNASTTPLRGGGAVWGEEEGQGYVDDLYFGIIISLYTISRERGNMGQIYMITTYVYILY